MERTFPKGHSGNDDGKLSRLKARIRTLVDQKNSSNGLSQSENDQKVGFNEAMVLVINEIDMVMKQNPLPFVNMPVADNGEWKPKFHPGSPSYGIRE